MLTGERKALILDRLRREGRVLAKPLSEELGLSEDTIRRDLRELAGEGLLQRVHGGALPASPALAPLDIRESVSPAGKIAIGRAAAEMVRPGQVVFLDGGTTAIQIARHLPPDLEATVVTHSPAVALELARHPRLVVETIGGRLFRHSMVAVGAAAAEAIGRVRADLYFMGVTGIHPEIGLTTGDAEEAAIKRLLSTQAAETVVLGSREKIGAVSAHKVVGWEAVDAVIVERGTPGLRSVGVTVVEA
ncbi:MULTISPECIES: DeoR/GlpR family DNA-binding transcription regulator [unclassified Aureimonas]|uniref:DeoR/GlpR family DNA-binding transcription regulator n=1 Tax=unclassified Aureimonas TaxID=2615206 RepID=UPI0006F37962|nr:MULTISPECIES: DeoR/GlpR family DNA-binding transcription regulator [unclassified Aureimonas]KQT69957.1 DeoR family transcriptional regulator [Aureimonas sp. Leaf427]KQT75887.1 DeoR family transcriptional regulator [Aureimonas sp. Leaf460]